MEYLPIDVNVANSVILELPVPGGRGGAIPGAASQTGGYTPPLDDYVMHNGIYHIKIRFQFPPKIISDSRTSTWHESEQVGSEPTYAFETSGPRAMSLSWSYVVDSFDTTSSKAWTVQRITHYIRTLRGYAIVGRTMGFLDKRYGSYADSHLVAFFRIWAIGGWMVTSIRIKTVDIKYGDSLVVPNYDPRLTFPLRTDITADINLWTPGDGEADANNPLAKVRGLVPLQSEWY